MTKFGYHASHEQHSPRTLLDYVKAAEAAGFDGVMCADHYHPWLEENGHSGYAWAWLGAALQATRLSFGVVSAPGYRYHPAVIAQAAATLAEMFPERFWLAIGSGEALNEHITGEPWPPKSERNERLRECADVMRRLWRGDMVTHRGRVIVEDARIYSLPTTVPRLLGAAVSEETAEWVGGWADGLITTGRPREAMARIIDAFRAGGGERDGTRKPVVVQHPLSWAPRLEEANAAARAQWRFSALERERLWTLRTPADFAAATGTVSVDDVASAIRISASLEEHAAWLGEYEELGVDEVYCFDVGKNQRRFIDAFGERVLPTLLASRASIAAGTHAR